MADDIPYLDGSDPSEDSPAAVPALDPATLRDALPDDLDPSLAGDYIFPNNNRRRIPGYLYLALAALLVGVWFARNDSALVNRGYLLAGVILAAFAVFSFVSGWNLDIDERDALVAATSEVGFPVGHASAQMGWRGLLSRPTWRILLYSAEDPPSTRGLVMVDGVNGEIVDRIVEENPEDWSQYAT